MFCSVIRVDNVVKRFGGVVAVDDATLGVDRGELVALLGPSGCGKTTLLRLIAGFERPDEGTIQVHGRRVAGDGAWVPPERRRIGMVFQDYALFPHLTVADNVGYGVARAGRRARVPELLALTGLDGLEARYPHELSGGQQQRVALARALAPSPEVVLLDEPWSNVDPVHRAVLREELGAILRRVGVTVVLVTHDRDEAFSLADRLALMRGGRIVQQGAPEEVYAAPETRWAAEFVGVSNFVRGRCEGDAVATALGRFPLRNRAANGEVDVLIRPELLELELDPAGVAEVVAREFRGHDVFYRVRVDGTELVSHRPSTELVPLGARVRIRPHAGRVTVFS